MPTVTLEAHAKVNLALSVGAPVPPDGYHPIASWMAPITLHDTVRVEPLPAGAQSSYDLAWADDAPRPSPIDWPLERDLAVRAHRLLELACAQRPRSLPARVSVRKRVPVGGGLGGGSADAAAALLALDAAFELGLGLGDLAALGLRLGSDVPFFLDGPHRPPRPALVGGLGEAVERLEHLPGQMCLVLPPFGCPTGEVYRALDAGRGQPGGHADADRVRALAGGSRRAGRLPDRGLFNDLEAPACAVRPQLGALLAALRGAGVLAMVTGSGSTVICPHAAQGQVRSALAGAHGDAAVLAVELAEPGAP